MKTHISSTHVLQMAACLAAVLLASAPQARSATVWTGPLLTFAETTTDPTLAINQDQMTANVWITRRGSPGIFNAKTETFFTHGSSPADTEWANGNIADYASLSFTNWNTWAKGVNPGPPSTVGVAAVVHLISEDIYVGVTFTSWGGSAGLFSYERTTPNAAVSPVRLSTHQIGNELVLTWADATFSLQSATNSAGSYTTIPGATSPYTNMIGGGGTYFRLIH
jgi:hypothetical protein